DYHVGSGGATGSQNSRWDSALVVQGGNWKLHKLPIGAGGFASVNSIADEPAALSDSSDFEASLREIFSLRSLTWSMCQSRSHLPLLHGHDQWPFTFFATRYSR